MKAAAMYVLLTSQGKLTGPSARDLKILGAIKHILDQGNVWAKKSFVKAIDKFKDVTASKELKTLTREYRYPREAALKALAMKRNRVDEAVAWLKRHRDDWDLTIVDLFLERGNGLGVLDACRQRAPHQKVVVLSNYATAEMRDRSRLLGADAFFDKSAELDQLVAYCETLHETSSHG